MKHRNRIIHALAVGVAVGACATATALATHSPASHGEPKNEWPFTRPMLTAGPRLDTAGASFLAELHAKLAGRWGTAWSTLYPFHQHVAPRSTYVSCEQHSPFPAEATGVTVEQVSRSNVVVPGLAQRIAGAAVRVRMTFKTYGPEEPISVVHVFHLVPFGGAWRWLLSQAEYDAYSSGGCLT